MQREKCLTQREKAVYHSRVVQQHIAGVLIQVANDDQLIVTIQLLGDLEVKSPDGFVVDISGSKPKAMIAVLALSPGMSESREKLANLLWSDRADEQARSSLRQALASLKRDLGSLSDILDVERNRISLNRGRVSIDAVQFQEFAKTSKAQEALKLYNGPLLEGLSVSDHSFEDWLSRERQRFNELAIDVHETRVKELTGRDRIKLARQLLELDTLREASHRILIETLAVAGERDQALRQYETCRELLERELGVKPSTKTRELIEQLSKENAPVPDTVAEALAKQVRNGTDRTIVAVLPFTNMSRDGGDDYFADGIAEDLITELARYRHLTVIGNKLSSLYKDRRSDLHGMRQGLGIDFLIDGSVRLGGSQVRVVVKLIDVETGTHVWGDRFDREMLDVFEVQDEIVEAVIARLAFNLDEAAHKQHQRNSASSGNAYTAFLKARSYWRNGKESLALRCAKEAVEIDPSYGRAYAYIAYFYAYSLFSQWTKLGEQEIIERSIKAIEKALSIDRTDPFILQRAALSYLMAGQPQNAVRCVEAAAIHSACDSEILVTKGLVLSCTGHHEEGVELLERALELEPRLAPGCSCALSEGRHMCRDYRGAMAALSHIVDPPYYLQLMEAINLARLGQEERAKRIVSKAPIGFNPAQFARSEARMCASPKDAEHWLESFRLAGVNV